MLPAGSTNAYLSVHSVLNSRFSESTFRFLFRARQGFYFTEETGTVRKSDRIVVGNDDLCDRGEVSFKLDIRAKKSSLSNIHLKTNLTVLVNCGGVPQWLRRKKAPAEEKKKALTSHGHSELS